MKKLMSIIFAILFGLSLTGLAFAQTATPPAQPEKKMGEPAPAKMKKHHKWHHKMHHKRHHEKAMKTAPAQQQEQPAPMGEAK